MCDEWLEQARRLAYRHILYRLADRPNRYELAEDAASDAILQTLTRIRASETHFECPEKLRAYMRKAALNKARTQLGNWWNDHVIPDADCGTGERTVCECAKGRDPAGDAVWQEHCRIVRQELENMSSPCREVLTLHCIELLSYPEIAERLYGVQVETGMNQRIGRQVRACKSTLRRTLWNRGVDPENWL